MRICRFNESRVGLVEDDTIRDVTSVLLDALPGQRYPFPSQDVFIASLPSLGTTLSEAAARAPALPVSAARLLSPVANPGKVVAAPVNYEKHLAEVADDPNLHHQNAAHTQTIVRSGLFLKASSSVVGPSQGVVIRHPDRRTDHEVELAAIIGKPARVVAAKEALGYVAGYCIGLDITIRGPEDRSFRKSLDTYTVLGPWMVTADEIADPSGLRLSLTVNGETRQDASTSDLILNVAQLIELASSFYTLFPGDALMTGTPEGVGPIQPGDVMVAKIDRIGEMTVNVKAG